MRSGGRRRTGVITSLFAFVPLVDVVAFRGPFIFSRPSLQAVSLQAGLVSNESGDWINHGLLLSSFTDGLKPNPEAIDFLMRGLVASLGREFQAAAETKVTESALQSPCCGPDLDAIMRMESVDVTLAKLEQGQMSWREVLKAFVESSIDDKPLALRLLYIPTAMYALRQDSNNTPGKQRQRARADGKKRRNEIVELLSSQLGQHVVIQAVSLDLDDGSVKQPEGSDNPSVFPKNGKEALQSWRPNMIYVQGGNTFWLYHCIEKGNWGDDIVRACTGDIAAVYCGTSAGAIIMGESMETACWKEWDNPEVVPNRCNYADWKGVKGFGLVGDASFFPHMNDTWKSLVKKKVTEDSCSGTVFCLKDEEVCCVQGTTRQCHVLVVSKELVRTE